MLGGDSLAFLPHLQESVMDELRTTEGMIFRDEGVKKLFLDLKCFVLEPLQVAYNTNGLLETLEMYLNWDEIIAKEEMKRMQLGFLDAIERLTGVCVLYAKYIYARSNPDSTLSIRRPRMENMLRGMFTRLARIPSLKNGSFFLLDPMRQDFVMRDVFRLALGNDCISIIITNDSEVFVKDETLHQHPKEQRWLERDDDSIGPDDSISRVMTREMEKEAVFAAAAAAKNATAVAFLSSIDGKVPENADSGDAKADSGDADSGDAKADSDAKAPTGHANANAPTGDENENAARDLEGAAEVKRLNALERSVVHSTASALSTLSRRSEFKKPTNVRRVIIEEEEEKT